MYSDLSNIFNCAYKILCSSTAWISFTVTETCRDVTLYSPAFPLMPLGFFIFGEIFAYVTVFWSNHRGSHIPSLWMVHTGCVLLPAFTHLGHEYQDLWVHAMECMRAQTRPWFILSSKKFWGNGVRNHVNSKEKIPSTGSSEVGQILNSASCKTANPTHYPLSNAGSCYLISISSAK